MGALPAQPRFTEEYFAACHEVTRLIADGTLDIACRIDCWKRNSWPDSAARYAERTDDIHWLLRKSFAEEGYLNAGRGDRIESFVYLREQHNTLLTLMNIHGNDTSINQTPQQDPFGLKYCSPDILKVFHFSSNAFTKFEDSFARLIKQELTIEVVKERVNAPPPRAFAARSRAINDIKQWVGWMRGMSEP